MTKIFIAGSRQVSRLSAEVKQRIDTMIEKDFTILVGDANGADKAVQRYLSEKGYRDVLVHCMAGDCRNNLGNWPIREAIAKKGVHGFAYYATKDQSMVDEASYGLMVWDCESKGTLNNVINMVRQEKSVVVYLSPQNAFQSVRSADDVTELLGKCDRASARRLERELGINPVPQVALHL